MRTRVAMLCSVVAVACILGVVPMVEADPVVYSEFSSGEVDGHAFTFDVGTNSISGLFRAFCPEVCEVERLDPDHFFFYLPAHTELVEIRASFPISTFFSLGGGSFGGGGVGGSISYDPFDFFGFPCRDAPCFTGDPLPWGPGEYGVQSGLCWGPHSPSFVGPFPCEYELDFTVAATKVPEPSATLFLLGTGLAGLSGFAWWRRRN